MMVSLFERKRFTLLISTLLMGRDNTMMIIIFKLRSGGTGCYGKLGRQVRLVMLVPPVSIKDCSL